MARSVAPKASETLSAQLTSLYFGHRKDKSYAHVSPAPLATIWCACCSLFLSLSRSPSLGLRLHRSETVNTVRALDARSQRYTQKAQGALKTSSSNSSSTPTNAAIYLITTVPGPVVAAVDLSKHRPRGEGHQRAVIVFVDFDTHTNARVPLTQ